MANSPNFCAGSPTRTPSAGTPITTTGSGHRYQGRFKAFPIQEGDHFLTALRYVERNAVRAGLCAQAKLWRWGSLAHRRAAAFRLALSCEHSIANRKTA